MSSRRRLCAPALLLALALGGCSTGDAGDAQDAAPGNAFPTIAPPDPGPGDGDPAEDDLTLDPQVTAGSPACALVREGIDAFNEGDFEETVDRFAQALPLAEADAEDPDATDEAALLVGAVRYYAELEPQDYATAPATADFETNKQITLGLCVTPGEPLAPPESGGTQA